ncbi:hypothetical protein N658DRAFT_246915 [Parathielavia hyrcaniae]|uniref:Uncharacterized protein n=1 Tax=Parathielavia hyrcaniae TaxID=113614 RepID=A0AAN6Q5Z6_9PEZI|nr:hypothetical protein N658DRAFT_246915 [Parathielavia hyrcaniae]
MRASSRSLCCHESGPGLDISTFPLPLLGRLMNRKSEVGNVIRTTWAPGKVPIPWPGDPLSNSCVPSPPWALSSFGRVLGHSETDPPTLRPSDPQALSNGSLLQRRARALLNPPIQSAMPLQCTPISTTVVRTKASRQTTTQPCMNVHHQSPSRQSSTQCPFPHVAQCLRHASIPCVTKAAPSP